MPEKPEYVYTLSDPRDNSVRYVGKTNNPQERLIFHLSLRESNQPKNEWIQELQGLELTPTMTVIETVYYDIPHKTTASQREKYWIDFYRRQGAHLFNVVKKLKPRSPVVYKDMTEVVDELDALRTENTRLRAENMRLRAIINQASQILNLDDLAS